MKNYSVAPNQDASAWIVKLEDIAPADEFEAKDDAIAKAEEMAKENSPSKLSILDKEHNVIREERF
ncbi:hypothetical protein SAMN05216232_1168 [Virgibacillus subterraneus]|uniref:DUF2188 domain-containing protein n=1 Tax=Virgibacillus subterraneus TaxID=621109 RepID=A0A1H9BF17_9BACI|nr:DUF2188 domain-containing protein [Virgibacillus subterraneus]SEP87610.1 hypothetical protein SAMN05216232_1168 [Virgibacillus subterraneus]